MCDCKCKADVVEVFFYSEKYDDGRPIQDLVYANPGDACVDIRCKEDITIHPGTSAMIGTGLYVALPVGYEMQIRPRSGISAKTSLIFKNTIGTLDEGYRNEIFVIWYNLGDKPVGFLQGDRIAQAKIEKVLPVKYTPVESSEVLKGFGNDRGGGFGSTGLK